MENIKNYNSNIDIQSSQTFKQFGGGVELNPVHYYWDHYWPIMVDDE
jgi:hypothetical protein